MLKYVIFYDGKYGASFDDKDEAIKHLNSSRERFPCFSYNLHVRDGTETICVLDAL